MKYLPIPLLASSVHLEDSLHSDFKIPTNFNNSFLLIATFLAICIEQTKSHPLVASSKPTSLQWFLLHHNTTDSFYLSEL